MYARLRYFVCACTYVHIYIHTYIQAYTHTVETLTADNAHYVQVNALTAAEEDDADDQVSVHTYIHTYIHTCIHAYTHTYSGDVNS